MFALAAVSLSVVQFRLLLYFPHFLSTWYTFSRSFSVMSPPGIPRSVLITGANRGIGLGLVKEFAKHGEMQHIMGTTRSLEQAQVQIDRISLSQSRLGAARIGEK